MAFFKCKMCGGTIEFEPGATVGVCDSCGTKQTLPNLDTDRKTNLYDRANHFRRNNDFDKAAGIYEQILNDDPSDAEAYWSLVLCNYGIEYVEDPLTHKRIPTVNRAQFTSVFDDANYKSAIERADAMRSRKGFSQSRRRRIHSMCSSAIRRRITTVEGHRILFWRTICTINLFRKGSKCSFPGSHWRTNSVRHTSRIFLLR